MRKRQDVSAIAYEPSATPVLLPAGEVPSEIEPLSRHREHFLRALDPIIGTLCLRCVIELRSRARIDLPRNLLATRRTARRLVPGGDSGPSLRQLRPRPGSRPCLGQPRPGHIARPRALPRTFGRGVCAPASAVRIVHLKLYPWACPEVFFENLLQGVHMLRISGEPN